MTASNYTIETPTDLTLASVAPVLSHSEKLAQTVALLQNSINEEEKKLNAANQSYATAVFEKDRDKADTALLSIAGLKSKIEAYRDCSDLILDTMQA